MSHPQSTLIQDRNGEGDRFMALSDEITTAVRIVVDTPFITRNGQVVPETESVALQDGAVKVDATYVYADLADSSKAAQTLNQDVTAKIIRSYLNAATRTLSHYGGAIRSFDGDRVMAIFIGNPKNNNAVRAALALNWSVEQVIKPKLTQKWPTLWTYWTLKHGVGIATGNALIVRGGVRDNNDLVSIGEAPNVAAKLSELRDTPATYITQTVYDQLNDPQKLSGDRTRNMWTNQGTQSIGGKTFAVLGSAWYWQP